VDDVGVDAGGVEVETAPESAEDVVQGRRTLICPFIGRIACRGERALADPLRAETADVDLA
jgi:hypothetical protein